MHGVTAINLFLPTFYIFDIPMPTYNTLDFADYSLFTRWKLMIELKKLNNKQIRAEKVGRQPLYGLAKLKEANMETRPLGNENNQ
jgi:hypothetical protein